MVFGGSSSDFGMAAPSFEGTSTPRGNTPIFPGITATLQPLSRPVSRWAEGLSSVLLLSGMAGCAAFLGGTGVHGSSRNADTPFLGVMRPVGNLRGRN